MGYILGDFFANSSGHLVLERTQRFDFGYYTHKSIKGDQTYEVSNLLATYHASMYNLSMYVSIYRSSKTFKDQEINEIIVF
jgi:hypothetical protein